MTKTQSVMSSSDSEDRHLIGILKQVQDDKNVSLRR